MPLLPSGFALPPLPYLLVLSVGVGATVALLYRARPPVTPQVVLGFTPWMVVGATLYALYQARVLPPGLAPLFGSPAVYLTTFVFAGLVWFAGAGFPADEWGLRSAPGLLLIIGGATAGIVVGTALDVALSRDALKLAWPLAALIGAAVIAGVTWLLASRGAPQMRATGGPGALVVFGHTLDGVSTALGTALGFAEQSPLSRLILQIGNLLPTAPYVGAGWLFVVVKLALAVLVAYLLADPIHENPRETYLLLAFVAAVGLGPGVHNLVLFAITGS